MKKLLHKQGFSPFFSLRRNKARAIYAIFIGSVSFDLATTVICFQSSGLIETNPIHQIVGVWAFPLVYLIDAGMLLIVEWLRKYTRWIPIILFIPIFAYLRASIINLKLILG